VRSREIARRYADALYAIAAEEGHEDQMEGELGVVVEEIAAVPDFARFLAHPLVTREQKLTLMAHAFPELSQYVRNMLQLLIRNGREVYADLIYDEFLAARAEAEGLTRVRVTTAGPLSEEDRHRLHERLTTALGRAVKLDERLDEGLLAGARIEVEGNVIDGTLRAQLSELKAVLGGSREER
jgi:F-type H+-transporting ATPase subunit delta